jgi:hypothetical protein
VSNPLLYILKRNQNSADIGYSLADKIVKQWNAQPNPPKVYINDNRIHHGYVGFVSTALGFIGLLLSALEDDHKTRNVIANASGLLLGAGVRLMEDDIADANDWFNFENNQNQLFSNTTGYNQFV